MWFLLLKIFKFGFSQAKKHNANKKTPSASTSDDASNPSSFNMAARSFMQPTPPPPARKPLKHHLALALPALQFIFAIAVMALYGSDIHHAHERGDSAPAAWVFAVVTAFLACVTALAGMGFEAFGRKRNTRSSGKGGVLLGMFVWLGVMVILWLVVFGIFAGKFVGSDKKKMRRTVWVDLVCLVLAVGAAVWAGLRWWRGNRGENDNVMKEEGEEEKEVV